MKILFINNWIADETLNALGWTLFHSLWIGLLAAVASGIIIIFTRKSTARLRYNLLTGVMFLFLVSCTITFFIQTQIPKLNIVELQETGTGIVNISDSGGQYVFTDSKNFVDTFTQFFNSNSTLFVFIWLIFFVVHCIKIMSGLSAVYRLRNYRTDFPGDEWIAKLNELSSKLGVRQSVILLQSELIKVPVAVGFLKPAILVPIGLLSNLPPEQVEAILLHELAHIRRKDYLINLFQRFGEMIFFFNPAFIWLCSLIRQEREACCDDIVVATTGQERNYLEALVSFQEYSFASSEYTMAIRSKEYYLLNRVKRLLTRENKKLNTMEKILLLFGLIVFTAFTVIPPKEENKKKKIKNTVTINQPADLKVGAVLFVQAPVAKVRDTVPPKVNDIRNISTNVNIDGNSKTETITAIDAAGKKYTIVRVNDKLTSLQVDSKTIPENEIGNYASIINQIDVAREKKRERKLKELEAKILANEKKREEQQGKLKEKNKVLDDKLKAKIGLSDSNSEEVIKKKIEAKRKELDADREVLDKKRKEISDVKKELIAKKQELKRKDVKGEDVTLKEIKSKEKILDSKLKEVENRKKVIEKKKDAIEVEKEKLERAKERQNDFKEKELEKIRDKKTSGKENEANEKEKEKDAREKEKVNEKKKETTSITPVNSKSLFKENRDQFKPKTFQVVSTNIFKRNSNDQKTEINVKEDKNFTSIKTEKRISLFANTALSPDPAKPNSLFKKPENRNTQGKTGAKIVEL